MSIGYACFNIGTPKTNIRGVAAYIGDTMDAKLNLFI